MRLRRLCLDRFGHFTDRVFDFGPSGDGGDFHIIHGPNEAGKTTAMEGALRLLYGFAHRESYDFKHQRKNLRVSAVVEIDGQPRQFTRLPLRSGALVDEAGTALPEAALAAHLGGLGEADYRNLLCLDDDTIERGGEEIAQARGDIGRLLFSAAAGVADLSTALDAVRDEADAIWRKRASKTQVAELKRALAEVEKEMRERDISASAWRTLKRALAGAQAAEAEARAARDRLQARAATLDALRRALPQIAGIDALAARIAPFAAYPERLDFDPESLVALVADESGARADIARLTGEIAALSAERDALDLVPDLPALAGQIEALDDLRSRDATAGLDLPRRRELVAGAEATMARAARDLGLAEGAGPADLVLSPADIARLDAAREALRRAEDAAETGAREVDDLAARHQQAQAACARAEAPGAGEIAALLARHDADRLAPAVARARQAIEAAEEAERAARAALSRGGARLDTLPACPMSPAEAAARAEAHAGLVHRIDGAEEALAAQRGEIAGLRARAEQIVAGAALVPDAEAAALMARRARLWQAHRAALDEASAQEFEAAMEALDAAMQSRLTQARDLGELRRTEQAVAEAEARADEAQARLTALRARRDALEGEIAAAANAVGLPAPLAPAEWRDWVAQHASALEGARALDALRARHGGDLDRAGRLLADLGPHLDLVEPDFDGALAAARARAEAERAALAATERARQARATLADELARRRACHEAALGEAREAGAAWRALVSDLLGARVAPATLRASLDPLRALREASATRDEAAQRVSRMEADQAQFAAAVAALAEAWGAAQADTPAATFARLRETCSAAQAAEAQAERLSAQIAAAHDARQEARRNLERIGAEVEARGRIFPPGTAVDTLDALRRAAAQAQQVIGDREDMAAREAAVLSELGVPDMAAARARLDGMTAAALDAEAATVKADLAAAERDLTAATEARVTAAQALAQVTGEADIAALAQRKATIELEIEAAARDHLELSLGHHLAEEAIRRYRDTHRSAMMAATEAAFAALTQGAYTRLVAQPEGNGEILLAVDAGGAAKRVAEMSKGTRFQLYLALRAAAHEQLVAQGTCLPFFCDDIFETFDEHRTAAACRVMERIGQRGQAIYLTHHRHVVEIAREVCDRAPVVHMLGEGGSGSFIPQEPSSG
jgi:uncharacterized protein YhaN